MSVERVFCDWSKPFLPQAAELLLRTARRRDRWCDLSGAAVVLAGNRAKRRLLELLVEDAEREDAVLIPPELVTVGELPELLIGKSSAEASALESLFAWMEAIASSREAVRGRFVPDQSALALLRAAQLISGMFRELAGESLTFADVASRLPELAFDVDVARWTALSEIADGYLEILARRGRIDRDMRRLDTRGPIAFERELFLLSTVDLNRVARDALSGVSASALIHAPAAYARRFDTLGCLQISAWLEAPIEIDDCIFRRADRAQEQAWAVAMAIAELEGRYRAEEITVGLGDETLGQLVVEEIRRAGAPARLAAGRALSETPPGALLRLLGEALARNTFRELATFARHPDVEAYLAAACEGEPPLAVLDAYYQEHLPRETVALGRGPTAVQARAIVQRLDALLAPLRNPRRVKEWAEPFARLITTVLPKCARGDLDAFDEIHELLMELAQVDAELTVSAAEALDVLLGIERRVRPEPAERAIDVLGWLELQLDDAPGLILAGVNEGVIPQSINTDPFLPNALRSALGLLDNDRRYARDAFALSAMLRSRDEVRIVVGRRNNRLEAVLPSRLFFSCPPEQVAQRVRRFAAPLGELEFEFAAGGQFHLPVPPKPLAAPIRRVAVRALNDYLRCPYRFYLRHGLGLERQGDDDLELSRAVFGSVIHEVLRQFSLSEERFLSEAEKLARALESLCDSCLRERFGASPLPAIVVQREQLKSRLRDFALWQASRNAAGWEISAAEVSVQAELPELELVISGRIDRLDFHPQRGTWAIIDYKVRDAVVRAREAMRQGAWVDLQLPVYRELAPIPRESTVELGYVTLGAEATEADWASWSPEQIAGAWTRAKEIATLVRSEVFWPPVEVRGLDDFAVLCGTAQRWEGE